MSQERDLQKTAEMDIRREGQVTQIYKSPCRVLSIHTCPYVMLYLTQSPEVLLCADMKHVRQWLVNQYFVWQRGNKKNQQKTYS